MINFIKRLLKKKKFILLILGVLCFSFLLPQLAHADAFGIMDIFSMQLDALDFLDNSVRQFIVFTALIIAESMAYLGIGAAVLDWAMGMSVNITHNPLIIAGWGLVSGLANLVIIISFVWTALSIIFKGDSAQGQKTLFRLIGLAILINFSMLIMGAVIDVAGFIQSGIMNAFSNGGVTVSLAKTAQDTLFQYSTISLAQVVGMALAEVFASLIPVGNVAAIVVSAVGFLTLSITGWLPVMIFNVILNFLVGSTFFMLAAILLMRICFLWILAITAPLAIVLYKSELPGLDRFFNEWFKMLTEWLFAGVVIIFFLGLGFKLFGMSGDASAVIQGNPFTNVDIFGNFVPSFFLNYLFLFLYMIVVCVILSKSWMPSMGQQIIDRATGFASKVNKTFTPKIKRDLVEWEARTQIKNKDKAEMSSEEFAEKYHKNGEYRDATFNKVLEKPFSAYRKYVKREAPGGAQRERDELVNKASGKYKDLTAEQLKELISTEIAGLKTGGVLNTRNLAGALTGMSSKEVSKFMEQNENDANIMRQVNNTVISGNQDLKEKIARASIKGDDGDFTRITKILGSHFDNDKYYSKLEEVVANTTGEKALGISSKAIAKSPELLGFIAKHWTANEVGAKASKDNLFMNGVLNPNFGEINRVATETNNVSLKKYLSAGTTHFAQSDKKGLGAVTPSSRPDYESAGAGINMMEKQLKDTSRQEPGSSRTNGHETEPGSNRDKKRP